MWVAENDIGFHDRHEIRMSTWEDGWRVAVKQMMSLTGHDDLDVADYAFCVQCRYCKGAFALSRSETFDDALRRIPPCTGEV